MNEREMTDELLDLLRAAADAPNWDGDEASFAEDIFGPLADGEAGARHAQTFEEAGVLTTNQGLTVRMRSGAEFQITVVQSR